MKAQERMSDTCVELRSEDEQSMEEQTYMETRIQHNICGYPLGLPVWEAGELCKKAGVLKNPGGWNPNNFCARICKSCRELSSPEQLATYNKLKDIMPCNLNYLLFGKFEGFKRRGCC